MVDTTEVAAHLGTTPRMLRAFLRSPISTYQAVGSGARYEFTERDLPTLRKRFSDWNSQGKPKGTVKSRTDAPAPSRNKPRRPAVSERDAEVWAEEGPVVIEDIRDPRVRARVKRRAREAEEALALRLIALGMHVSQGYTRRVS